MASFIEKNAFIVLRALLDTKAIGGNYINGYKLQRTTSLSPEDINDAVTLLEQSGLVEWRRYLGTAPFVFGHVKITPRGKYEYEKSVDRAEQPERPKKPEQPMKKAFVLLSPVGSPYGFTDGDYEHIERIRSIPNRLNVVFGLQWESKIYDSKKLKENIEKMFKEGIVEHNRQQKAIKSDLDFKVLAAGYGEHLFNEIARDIMSADIAVFETSDKNPNVMIELGVALTHGVRILPIKEKDCERPPSDISGQTYADYVEDGSKFLDPEHMPKLIKMIDRAVRKKET